MFHDIMPGSGIGINYVDAVNAISTTRAAIAARSSTARSDDLAARADTQGAGIPVVVYNPLSWDRSGRSAIEVHTPPAGQHLRGARFGRPAAALANCRATIPRRRTSLSK